MHIAIAPSFERVDVEGLNFTYVYFVHRKVHVCQGPSDILMVLTTFLNGLKFDI